VKKPIPRTDSGTPPREEQTSSHDFDLTPIFDANDDEDSGEDTAMLIAAAQQPRANPFQSFAVYIHGKHRRLTKRVAGIEKKLDRATWTVSLAAAFGLALFELLKLFLSTHGK
jgi:hypothetical protein